MSGTVRFVVEDNVAHVWFDRPEARNAMTFAMYEELEAACTAVRNDPSVRVAVFRGVGGQAFVAGTDIKQFLAFRGPEDGVAYEQRIDTIVDAVETLPVPTVAVVEGYAMGGGFALASACDLRLITPDATFGYPIARTVGNCLSMANIARLVCHFGPALARKILLLAEVVDAKTALSVHFTLEAVEKDHLDARLHDLCAQLKRHAPLTMRASKEAIRRLMLAGVPDGRDIIEMVYSSNDFRHGVESFLAKARPTWAGE